jgi:RNA recognition motif-containing protein
LFLLLIKDILNLIFKMKLFVAKLSYDTMENDLRDAFEKFGEVDSVKVVYDKEAGRSKGFAFVEMPDDDQARDAIASLNDTELDGRTIVVKEAEDRPKSSGPRPGGFGGGGGRSGGGGGFRSGGGGGRSGGGGDRGGRDRNSGGGGGYR